MADTDCVYKYSDDNGNTWSSERSPRHLWDSNEYAASYPSACSGIQIEDGTLLVPTMVVKNGSWRSGLLIKRPNHDWYFSKPTQNDGDNECSVYVDQDNQIVLDCRTTNLIHRKYFYNINIDEFSLAPNHINVVTDLKAEICRINGISKDYYLTTYVNTEIKNYRENLSLYASRNGYDWRRVYQLQEGFNGFGYGSIACRDKRVYLAYEDYQVMCIKVQDLTLYSTNIESVLDIK